MTLNSFSFVVFLAVVLFVELLASRLKNQVIRSHAIKVSLILFSLLFMLAADWRFAICLFAYATFVFGISHKIDISRDKRWVVIGVLGSLGLLGYFKYANFLSMPFARC